jgi:Domain of unknown function (DUF4412)
MRFSSGLITASMAFLAAAAPLSAQGFEGRIALKLTGDNGAPHDMEYQVKDNKFRFEAPNNRGQSAAIIIDPSNQKMLILMSAQKMYMERPMGAVAPMARPSQQAAAAHATVTASGRKETIAGYQCEHYLVTDDQGNTVDACLAHGLGSFMSPPSGNPMAGQASPNDWSSKIGKDVFPLKVTKGDKTLLEVTKIEKASLDPSLFAPPEGWRKFDMPNIPGMRPPQH